MVKIQEKKNNYDFEKETLVEIEFFYICLTKNLKLGHVYRLIAAMLVYFDK